MAPPSVPWPVGNLHSAVPPAEVAPLADDVRVEVLKEAALMDEGQRPIYLDMQATTPIDPRVLDAMMPYMTEQYGNAHSRTHHFGWESEKAVENARQSIASLIKADPKEVVFTSGATESNNAAIKGIAHFYSQRKKHIITT